MSIPVDHRPDDCVRGQRPRLTAWVVGQKRQAEFYDALRSLEDRTTLVSGCSFEEIRQRATNTDAPMRAPDLIVLLQSYAGEFRLTQLMSTVVQYPLAPVICLLGAYSEGETRSGQPIQNAHRVHWYNAAERIETGFDAWDNGLCPWWSLPATMTAEDRWLARSGEQQPRMDGRIVIAAALPDFARPTVEWLERHGAIAELFADQQSTAAKSVEPSADANPIVCAVWDSAAAPRHRPPALEGFVERVAPAPVIAQFTFPRTQDVEFARSAGAARVLPKLIAADELLWHIRDLTSDKNNRPLRLHDPAA